jgi:hypothetical protein
MKYLRGFNESRREELIDRMRSEFQVDGSIKEYEEKIKDDIASYFNTLLDDEVELIHQLAQLNKGEISEDEVDKEKILGIATKFSSQLMNIVRGYNKFK